jgi:glycosyltransferase A (GT-A) superfamily protein (DUF2064 family)
MATEWHDSPLQGTIVVVAKCPIRGKSKTRLIPLLGQDGSVALAKAMLSDVLLSIDKCSALANVHKILLYAPGTSEGLEIMKTILEGLGLVAVDEQRQRLELFAANKLKHEDAFDQNDDDHTPNTWVLLPMLEGDLTASDLGAKLQDALVLARTSFQAHMRTRGTGVVFLGMDSPILSLEDIAIGLYNSSTWERAMLCPAEDGGYGMLCVPLKADPQSTFSNMLWSHSLTALSQIKTLTDQDIMVTIGRVMKDVDEPEDVEKLCHQLCNSKGDESSTTTDVNAKNLGCHHGEFLAERDKVFTISTCHPSCHFTRQALKEAGLLTKLIDNYNT